VDVVLVVVVCHELEGNSSVDEEQDHSKHSGHEELIQVGGDTLDDSLECGESLDNIEQMHRVEDGTLE